MTQPSPSKAVKSGTPSFIEEPILTVPIRLGTDVRIHGIPWNLTPDEAAKIIAVVKAFAAPPSVDGEG